MKGTPLSVLIVEDSVDDAGLMLRQLQHAGFEATHERVETAGEMAAALKRRAWDVILSDFRLPGFSAGEALSLLRGSGLDIPFIVVSGVIEEGVAVELMRGGAHDYLMKDNLSRLAPAVTRELAEARIRQEHRRAEEALRENEERFRSLANSAIDAIVAIDEDGLIRFFSRGAETTFGHSAAEIIGQPVTLLMPEEYREGHTAGFRRYLETRQPRVMGKVVELAGRGKNGETFPVEMSLSVATVGGRMLFSAIIRNISERKRTELELRRRMEEEERARAALLGVLDDQREATTQIRRLNTAYAVLSQTNSAIVRLGSRDELFRHVCRIAVESGGYRGAWIGLLDEAAATLQPVASAGSLDEYIERIRVSTDPAQTEGRRPAAIALRERRPCYLNDFLNDPVTAPWRGDALEFDFRAVAALPLMCRNDVVGTLSLYSTESGIFDERMRALLEEMARDVSFALDNFDREALRQRAEAAVRESEMLFRGLIEQNVAAIFMLERGRITFANPRTCEIFGYTESELEGMEALQLVVEADRAEVGATIQRVDSGETKAVERNFTCLRKDGSLVDLGARAIRAVYKNRPVILGVAQDIGERKKAQEEIQRYIGRLEQAVMATLEAVSTMVELRDPYTSGHERRVGELAAAIGAEMGLPENAVKGLRMTGYVHDIGKISVPAEILSKPGRLSEVEFEIIKGHARSGYDILKGVEFPWPLPEVILQHHERLDGSGYPQHLKGDQIILEARIMAVADVVESMASHRPYRPALGVDKALEEIEHNRGRFFDPQAADACLRLFRDKGYLLPR